MAVFVCLDMSEEDNVNNVTRRVIDLTGATGHPKTRVPQEDMAPTYRGRHDGCWCYLGCRPRPEGVDKDDDTDP